MRNIHEEAAEFGIERPELERQEYIDGEVTVIALTPQSEQDWANYLRSITMAKLALRSQVQPDTIVW